MGSNYEVTWQRLMSAAGLIQKYREEEQARAKARYQARKGKSPAALAAKKELESQLRALQKMQDRLKRKIKKLEQIINHKEAA